VGPEVWKVGEEFGKQTYQGILRVRPETSKKIDILDHEQEEEDLSRFV